MGISKQAHRGGLAHAVGWGTAIATAGAYGTITLWPEAELRSIAEAAGFVLPQRPPQFAGDAASARLSISEVGRAVFKGFGIFALIGFSGRVVLRVPRCRPQAMPLARAFLSMRWAGLWD